ncbi:MAG: hypothetical protein LBG07_00635 [Treponema sp.]|nr:hypothetical protein [Treponema sp.]
MKKYFLSLGIVVLMILSACASTPKDLSPIDRGQYPADIAASKPVFLYIEGNVGVFGIDNGELAWVNKNQREQFANIEPGLRVFQVAYNDGKLMSSSKVALVAQLEAGRSYLLKAVTDAENVSFAIVQYEDGQEGEEAHFYLVRE